ncbi:MAG: hypothetical protein KC493_07765 [Bacteriovoracaceae bacterium]|nr:hypothetical protein [Bacteriovoracaceae bacterium]
MTVPGIKIKNARTNNLKSVDVEIPLNSITTICGPSGSGKSSLAFHTLLAESTRRFANSFPAKMRLFFDIPSNIEVDSIRPILPAWGLPQNNPVMNSRYNVLEHIGALDSILKIFFVKGRDYCKKHKSHFQSRSMASAISEKVKTLKPSDSEIIRIFLSKDKHADIFSFGPSPSRSISDELKLIEEFNEEHQFWEIMKLKGKSLDKLEKKIKDIIPNDLGELYGVISTQESGKVELFHIYPGEYCSKGKEPKTFSIESTDHISPLNAVGACKNCKGHGMILKYDKLKMIKNPNLSLKEGAINTLNHSRISAYSSSFLSSLKKDGIDLKKPFSKITEPEWRIIWEGNKNHDGLRDLIGLLEQKKYKSTIRIYLRGIQSEYPCPDCESSALAEHSSSRYIKSGTKKLYLSDAFKMSLDELKTNFSKIDESEFKDVAWPLKEIKKKLLICNEMGLGHLNGTRKVRSLSSGEYQRLLLVKYLSYQGEGSLFVLDEPSLGLGLKEQKSLFKYIKGLKKQGNTILMVEHSDFFIKNADHLITMGPGAGLLGGEVTSAGKPKSSNNKVKFESSIEAARGKTNYYTIKNVSIFEKEKINIQIPTNRITWVNGDSGSGKSLYLVKSIAPYLNRLKGRGGHYNPTLKVGSTTGFNNVENIVILDGSMSGISSRSTIATYLDIAGPLRKYYSSLPISKSLNLKEGHFSPNSDLGKCPTCEGRGKIEVDMTYFEEVDLVCEDCNGKKIRPYLAEIRDHDHSFIETINNPLDIAFSKIKLTPKYRSLQERLKMLNLIHLNPDRKINSLSGGERLRVKLLSSLQKKIKNSLLIFENISFGLSNSELNGLGALIEKLTLSGNTIVIIDQNVWFKNLAQFEMTFKGLGKNPKLRTISS